MRFYNDSIAYRKLSKGDIHSVNGSVSDINFIILRESGYVRLTFGFELNDNK